MIYTESTRKLVREWAEFLGTRSWDYFTTITFPFDMNRRNCEQLMIKLHNELMQLKRSFNMFWVAEYHSNGRQAHIHLLIEGKWVVQFLNNYLQRKYRVRKQGIVHFPYDSQKGAAFYISKHIKSPNTVHDFYLFPEKVNIEHNLR